MRELVFKFTTEQKNSHRLTQNKTPRTWKNSKKLNKKRRYIIINSPKIFTFMKRKKSNNKVPYSPKLSTCYTYIYIC